MGEIKFNKEKYDTKMGYLTMMNGRLSAYGLETVAHGNNKLATTDKLVTMYQDIQEIMRIYKWALGYDLDSLISIGVVWENQDIYTSKYYTNS